MRTHAARQGVVVAPPTRRQGKAGPYFLTSGQVESARGLKAICAGTVLTVFEDFAYHRQFATSDGASAVLEFSARVGERKLKGVDVLIEAIATLKSRGQMLRAVFVGDGPDRNAFASLAKARGIDTQINFAGAMPARAAFAKGRLLVVPSRAESLPYVVLEGIAAGLPLIATRVGGIPEIFGPDADKLLPPGNAPALADAIATRHSAGGAEIERLRARVSELFTVSAMTSGVLGAYERALSLRRA